MDYKEDYAGLSKQIKPWTIRSETEHQRLQKAVDDLENLPWTDGRSVMIDYLKEFIRDWKNG